MLPCSSVCLCFYTPCPALSLTTPTCRIAWQCTTLPRCPCFWVGVRQWVWPKTNYRNECRFVVHLWTSANSVYHKGCMYALLAVYYCGSTGYCSMKLVVSCVEELASVGLSCSGLVNKQESIIGMSCVKKMQNHFMFTPNTTYPITICVMAFCMPFLAVPAPFMCIISSVLCWFIGLFVNFQLCPPFLQPRWSAPITLRTYRYGWRACLHCNKCIHCCHIRWILSVVVPL